MKELKVTFRIVTPLFLAGANQQQAEFRLPSLKGALRFWYRAVDPEYRKWEGKIFGSTDPGEGQSRFLMRSSSIKWKSIPYSENCFKDIKYLGFSFILGQKEQGEIKKRSHLIGNKKFTVSFMLRPFKEKEDTKTEEPLQYWRRLMASLWLLGHIGGLGSRSRRGFGTLALERWDGGGIPEVEQIKKELPIAHRETSMEDWKGAFSQGIKLIQSWFDGYPISDHSVIDSESVFLYYSNEREYFTNWRSAMSVVDKSLSSFRKYRDEENCKDNKINRLALGLPREFSNQKSKTTTRYCHEYNDRIASPVWIRIIKIGDRYYPVIFILSTPFPKLVKKVDKKGTKGEEELEEEFFLDHKLALQKFRHHLKGWREIQ